MTILNLTQTRKQVLPYEFRMLPNGKVYIGKTDGRGMIVSRGQVENILLRDDLDVHRRRMYEAALEAWKQDEVQQ